MTGVVRGRKLPVECWGLRHFWGGYYAQGFPLYGAEFFKGSCGEGDIWDCNRQ